MIKQLKSTVLFYWVTTQNRFTGNVLQYHSRPQGKLCLKPKMTIWTMIEQITLNHHWSMDSLKNWISMMISPWRNVRKRLYVDNVKLRFYVNITKECKQIYRPFLANIKLLEAALNGHTYLKRTVLQPTYILITLRPTFWIFGHAQGSDVLIM